MSPHVYACSLSDRANKKRKARTSASASLSSPPIFRAGVITRSSLARLKSRCRAVMTSCSLGCWLLLALLRSLVSFGDHGYLSLEETTFGMRQGMEE